MKKGNFVIAEHPNSKSNKLARFYGIIQEITKTGSVVIKLADGTLIERQLSSIAVYIQPPSNWQELFRRKISFSQPQKGKMSRSFNTKSQHH